MHYTINDTTTTIGQATATVIADSQWHGDRITTLELVYPRYIHSELLTHRCLTADTELWFDLPNGPRDSKTSIYKMTLGEFWDKWENGSAEHLTRWGTPRRYDMKSRLNKMLLRYCREDDMSIGHTTITDCWFVGVKPVWKLTAGGYSVKATADHLILTSDGWKELQDIAPGKDSIYTVRRRLDEHKDQTRHRLTGGKWVSTWNKNVKPLVLERQGGVCADCGKASQSYDIHHLTPIFVDKTKAFDIGNVVALCPSCHKARHKVQGWQEGIPMGCIETRVDSIEYIGDEPVYDLSVASEYHNFVANGIVVHNCFSRNASSSRATPISVLVKEARDPVFFDSLGANQSGMQAGAEIDAAAAESFKQDWQHLANYVADWVENAAAKYNIHKQVLNRALEPFTRIRTLVTATDWDNFFKLRLSSDAQPEMRSLALAMEAAMRASVPKETDQHTPYSEEGNSVESVARCARVSYMRLDGKPNSHEDDERLWHQLLACRHMSPFEHCAYWEKHGKRFANFTSWQSLRNILETGDLDKICLELETGDLDKL